MPNDPIPATTAHGRILVVDHDGDARSSLIAFLAGHGYDAVGVDNLAAMHGRLDLTRFDLVVLDIAMSPTDGLEALRRLVPVGPPVVVYSAFSTSIDRIISLEIGADDCIVKPCDMREMLARLRMVLRRRAASPSLRRAPLATARIAEETSGNSLHFAGWRMDLGFGLLFDPANDLVALSPGEYSLLRAFAEHPRAVLSREQLMELAHVEDPASDDRTIDVRLFRLRRKLQPKGSVELIRTVRNEGYLFMPSVWAEQSECPPAPVQADRHRHPG
ncbi:response regulator transcription factor [Novosphingobium resinovorum]|uniref:response regulator transcription factor n=1 Tax=Novosphingobium resinovorum TaxID=158500 RepID=UPI002ED3313B|nr:response regulator transcription factor [Novosphingobium resinovorum]